MSDKLYTKTIEELVTKLGFDWDDYLFLLNNQDIFNKIDDLDTLDNDYYHTDHNPSVIYKKGDILNATFLSYIQLDFLRENNLINNDEWIEIESHEYWHLGYRDKTLLHYYKLYRILDDIWNYYRVNEQFGYNRENYMDFFKKHLKNIKITYKKVYMDHRVVEKYEII